MPFQIAAALGSIENLINIFGEEKEWREKG